MNNLTEKKIEFDVNSEFDESSFDENLDERSFNESLDERMKILTRILLMKVLTKEIRALHRAFSHVK